MTKARTDKAQTLKKKKEDSDVSFENDTEEEIDSTEIEEEDWVDYINRSTNDAFEKMGNAKIRCWNTTHKKMKWRLALRIATSPSERWLMKAAERNTELSSKYRTNRAIGRHQGKDGKMTSTIASNLLRNRLKT